MHITSRPAAVGSPRDDATLAKVLSSAVLGIDACILDVETEGVGLPDVAVKERPDRVEAAIKNAGFEFPDGLLRLS